jgi:hypothetical protein
MISDISVDNRWRALAVGIPAPRLSAMGQRVERAWSRAIATGGVKAASAAAHAELDKIERELPGLLEQWRLEAQRAADQERAARAAAERAEHSVEAAQAHLRGRDVVLMATGENVRLRLRGDGSVVAAPEPSPRLLAFIQYYAREVREELARLQAEVVVIPPPSEDEQDESAA